MKQHTITLYSYDELSKEAKERAHTKWREHNDYPFLSESLHEFVCEQLDARGITYDLIKLYYSFSYSQGDGLMFTGTVHYAGYEIRITSGDNHYCHSNTAVYDWYKDGEEVNPEELTRIDLKTIYHEVCNKAKHAGYDYIEHEDSEERFKECCEANEWTFEADGTMRNV